MLNIKCFVVNMVEENCYVVSDETKQAIIIDDGACIRGEHEAIDDYISRNDLTLTHSLNTHAHFDHTMGNAHIYKVYGLKPEISTGDAELYTNLSLQVQSILGRRLKVETAPLAPTLNEDDIISFGTHKLRVIETPGHTPGGICFYCREEAVLFSGDNLFEQSIGRTDFPGGNALDLISSLQNKVMTLPDNTVVYPGHGGSTTIEQERRYNPYLK